ncbi:DnaD domain protein [Ruminococcus sp.]|uniref:DnaD domain protein n=1 Tax=Ruminococcus sp. TaxID=41978 RepID=UPI0025CF5FD4|nr:DnaD domain protein [Ruminococcus sp.]MBQ8965347.1 DnaD domain protein [Ruminococcus sp.]
MEYNFDTDSWGASFSFPWAAAGGFIKSCSEAEIKILLCILAGARFTNSAVLSAMSGYSEADVDAAVEYWKNAGVLSVNGSKQNITANTDDKPHTFSDKKEPVSLVEAVKPKSMAVEKKVTVKYSQQEMKEKAENDAVLKGLINEIQSLQFSINGSEMAKIIELYELYKFDAPSIMLAADHCRAAGKCSIAYLHTVMVNWYDKGINSYTDVENEIIKAQERRTFENKVLRIFGMENKPSPKQREYMAEWNDRGYNFELIEIAYNKCLDVKNKLNFSYIDGILKNWASGGITTAVQVEQEDNSRRAARQQKTETEKPSFDLGEYDRYAQSIDLSTIDPSGRKDDDK